MFIAAETVTQISIIKCREDYTKFKENKFLYQDYEKYRATAAKHFFFMRYGVPASYPTNSFGACEDLPIHTIQGSSWESGPLGLSVDRVLLGGVAL